MSEQRIGEKTQNVPSAADWRRMKIKRYNFALLTDINITYNVFVEPN